MTKSLQGIFPRASQGFLQLNAIEAEQKISTTVNVERKRRGSMNHTELEYAMILEAQKREFKIIRYEFEGITLRWADMKYTPDFFVVVAQISQNDGIWADWDEFYSFKLIEVKGAHIWDRDIVRYKGARADWPEYQFEMWQKTKAGWKQKY